MIKFDIAILKHRKASRTRNQEVDWLQLFEKCSTVHRTAETFIEYQNAPKSRRDEIKDIGGFVGGLSTGSRKKSAIVHRQVLTLDADFAPLEFWILFQKLFIKNAGLVYSTHSHSPENPRYRLIIPLDRPVTPAEYEPIIRRVADQIGIDFFDHSGFDLNRLMYWPSASKDGIFEFNHQEGEPLCADDVLAFYRDWRDVSSWPMGSRETKAIQLGAKKQGDPLEKPGLVGAFCRIYDVESAIEEFLSDVYAACEVEGRYTFLEGSTAAGLVIHDQGRFAYSHHSTDPISGKLCNAFDLVRIHKFGHLDDEVKEDTPGNRLPSYQAMLDLIGNDKQVVQLLAREKLEEAGRDFSAVESSEPDDMDWIGLLDVDRKGRILSTFDNAYLIPKHSLDLKGRFGLNGFTERIEVIEKLPWPRPEDDQDWGDLDWSGIRKYLGGKPYEIKNDKMVKDCIKLIAFENRFHSVRDYLNSLKWDGIPRVERLFIDYLGAEDSAINRVFTKKFLAAAVNRIMVPGCKWDYIPVLIGPEGTGKSSIAEYLGLSKWFSNTFNFGMVNAGASVRAYEQLRGTWIIEVPEMSGMGKAEVENIKAFITSNTDSYRGAHKEESKSFKRQCVFIGTSNNKDFLVSQTGNRRFWPIEVRKNEPLRPVSELKDSQIIDQLWAEAMDLYLSGEPLYLSADQENLANQIQESHTERDEWSDVIRDYLDIQIPENWADLNQAQRLYYLRGLQGLADFTGDELQSNLMQRDRVSAVDIWVECFQGDVQKLDIRTSRRIKSVMRRMKGWSEYNGTIRIYGSIPVRGFIRLQT